MTEVHLILSKSNAPCFMNKHFTFQLEYIFILHKVAECNVNESMNKMKIQYILAMHTMQAREKCCTNKNASINKACHTRLICLKMRLRMWEFDLLAVHWKCYLLEFKYKYRYAYGVHISSSGCCTFWCLYVVQYTNLYTYTYMTWCNEWCIYLAPNVKQQRKTFA